MFDVTIYTDGACFGNPGVGGYGAILTCNGHERIVRGMSTKVTTNNRMELTAVIEAVKTLKKPCFVTVYTDSQYIITTHKRPLKDLVCDSRKNNDLWIELINTAVNGHHKIKFVKVKGHAGDELNERCDQIAKEQCSMAQKGE